jgi:hypothetical protein
MRATYKKQEKMDKRKIIAALLDFVSSTETDRKKSQKLCNQEEIFIQNIVQENIMAIPQNPPPEILTALKIKQNEINQKAGDNMQLHWRGFKTVFENFLKKTSVGGFLKFQAAYIFSALLALALLVVISGQWKHEKSSFDQLSSAKQYVMIGEDEVLQKTGIRMSAQLTGELAYNIKNQREHIYIKQGYWQVDTDYASFDKEIWFHFPGGGIKPMGAQFSIDVTSEITKITLIKGKIQTYSTDTYGVINKTTIENAPYACVYKSNDLASFYESDLLVDKSNSMVVQKMDLAEGNEQIFAYYNFVGSYISVLLNDGSRLSGVLKKVWGEKLNIQTDSGLVVVHGSNMTLVGLNTSNY